MIDIRKLSDLKGDCVVPHYCMGKGLLELPIKQGGRFLNYTHDCGDGQTVEIGQTVTLNPFCGCSDFAPNPNNGFIKMTNSLKGYGLREWTN